MAAATIRYYESLGLLRSPARTTSGYRRYSEEATDELTFIKKAQALGFSLDEISEILKLTRAGETPCDRVLSIAHQHLVAVEERIRQLQSFRDQLAAEVGKWDGMTAPTCEGLCQLIAMTDVRSTTAGIATDGSRQRRLPKRAAP